MTKVNPYAPTGPHPKQLEVLSAFDNGSRFVLLRCGRKWGKTKLMISWLFEMAMKTGLVCPYIAPNRVQAKNIAWADHVSVVLNELKKKGVPYKKNEVELSIELPNGGKVQLLGVENAESLRGISNWGAVGCDEYDDWSEDIWPLIIRPNLTTHNAPALIAGTPKGHHNLYKIEQSSLFSCFHYTSHDNPTINADELKKLEEEYRLMGEGFYRQEILASYEKPEGTVYSEWDQETHYTDFSYNPTLPVHLSWDFGINDPTVVLFFQPYGSEIRLIDYYEASDANLEHFVSYINSKPYKHAELETGDIAGTQRQLTTGKSPIELLSQMGHHVRSSSIPSIPDQVRQAHKFIPRLYISKSNPNTARFVECLLNYKYPKKDTTNEIPLHDQHSHAMRAFEYYCWNFREPNAEETKSLQTLRKRISIVRDATLGF